MECKLFAIIAVSLNANSFGLKRFVAIAQDGTAFAAHANSIRVPRQGAKIYVRLDELGQVDDAQMGWECREVLPKPSKKDIQEVFSGEAERTS